MSGYPQQNYGPPQGYGPQQGQYPQQGGYPPQQVRLTPKLRELEKRKESADAK